MKIADREITSELFEVIFHASEAYYRENLIQLIAAVEEMSRNGTELDEELTKLVEDCKRVIEEDELEASVGLLELSKKK